MVTGQWTATAGATGWAGQASVLALDLSIFLPGVYLALALLVAAAVLALLQRWRRVPGKDALDASDQLAQFRSLYEEGALSEEEYNRLRALLGGQLRQALDVPPRPARPQLPAPEVPPPELNPGPPSASGPTDTRIHPG